MRSPDPVGAGPGREPWAIRSYYTLPRLAHPTSPGDQTVPAHLTVPGDLTVPAHLTSPAHLTVPGELTVPAHRTVLDHLARQFPAASEAEWAHRMGRGCVSWDDGSRIGPDTPYASGRRLVYEREVPGEPEPAEPLRVLHCDDEILIVDKPAGVPVTPSGPFVLRSLLAQARRWTENPALTPAHRIDKDTAGLVLFVHRPDHRAVYQGLFARREIHKVYEAIGSGEGEPPAFTTVRSSILRSGDAFRWSSAPGDEGPARSDVYRIARLGAGRSRECSAWRFRVVPETGRPHQVRLHLAQLGFPLLGDPLYPERRIVPREEGALRLLAAELRFRDPLRPRWRSFRSEWVLQSPGTV